MSALPGLWHNAKLISGKHILLHFSFDDWYARVSAAFHFLWHEFRLSPLATHLHYFLNYLIEFLVTISRWMLEYYTRWVSRHDMIASRHRVAYRHKLLLYSIGFSDKRDAWRDHIYRFMMQERWISLRCIRQGLPLVNSRETSLREHFAEHATPTVLPTFIIYATRTHTARDIIKC